jgi:hypothetical protein
MDALRDNRQIHRPNFRIMHLQINIDRASMMAVVPELGITHS